jgi:hypothetical protein
MKCLLHAKIAVAVAVSLSLPSSLIAETPNSLDHLLGATNEDFISCSLALEIAETTSDTPGYGPNSVKTKAAYKKFYDAKDKAVANGESRFAAIKEELALKETALAALKDLYVYWRAEIAPCTTYKRADAVTSKFRLLTERVRAEASW